MAGRRGGQPARPLGLFAFGVGMLMLGAQSFEWVPMTQGKEIGVLLLTFVFPLQLVAGVFAYLARDTLAGTVLTFYARPTRRTRSASS